MSVSLGGNYVSCASKNTRLNLKFAYMSTAKFDLVLSDEKGGVLIKQCWQFFQDWVY
jgi:hypothetical protein